MDRNVSMEIARVTEAAAVASSCWIGNGKKNEADDAATTGMRHVFDTIPISGKVVIGEGEKDEAPMLYIGEQLGLGGPEVDVAVDPLEGTNLVAKGLPNALAVVAIADRGGMLHAPDMYMEKILVGPKAVGSIDLHASVAENIRSVAHALQKKVRDVVVVILDRPRHTQLMEEARATGARVKLITDGEVAVAMQVGLMRGDVDLLMGIGGAPEAVLSTAVLSCLGGEIQGRLCPKDESEYQRCLSMGIGDPNRIWHTKDLVDGEEVIFTATGVTNGEILQGVKIEERYVKTQSLVLRAKSGTVRFIEASHRLDKFSSYLNMND